MRGMHRKRFGRAGVLALTTSVITATAWAQDPAPPPPAGVSCEQDGVGPVRRALRHAGRALQDGLIGYPQEFYEPPLGSYVNGSFRTMKAKADPHRFTLYKTDFLVGESRFSPTGATRFNLMASRLAAWPGPVAIEWSPDQPGLAESRRAAVVAALQRARLPVTPDRVVIAPSPFPGGLGADAVINYNVMIQRDGGAPAAYTLTPTSASGFGAGGGGGGGGPR